MAIRNVGGLSVYVIDAPAVESAKTSTGTGYASLVSQLRWQIWEASRQAVKDQMEFEKLGYEAKLDAFVKEKQELTKALSKAQDIKEKLKTGQVSASNAISAARLELDVLKYNQARADKENIRVTQRDFIDPISGEKSKLQTVSMTRGPGGQPLKGGGAPSAATLLGRGAEAVGYKSPEDKKAEAEDAAAADYKAKESAWSKAWRASGIDNPEEFEQIVGVDTQLNYLFFKEIIDEAGSQAYQLVDNSDNLILIVERESLIVISNYNDGQLVYFYDSAEDQVKRVDRTTNTLILESTYKGVIGRDKIKFQYVHNASVDRRIDPSVSNIIDIFLLTRSYDSAFRTYLTGGTDTEPEAPNSDSLKISFGSKLDSIKSISDDIIYHPVKYKVLFGSNAVTKLQAQFKVVKNANQAINDNELKVRIVTAINEFFDIANWDFGDRFYLSELITYVLNQVSPDISNIIIVPRQTSQSFGSLFEIQSGPDEIFVNGATVDDIVIVSAITASEVRAPIASIVTTT
jgi:hypothetical protein